MPRLFYRRIHFQAGISTVFVVLVTALTSVIIWINYNEATNAALRTSSRLFQEITAGVDERMNGILGAVKATVDVASALPSLAERPRYDGLSSAPLEAMVRLFETRPYVFSVFVGHASGELLQVSASRGDPSVTEAFQVPDDADIIVRTISLGREGGRKEYLRYLNSDRHVVGARTVIDPDYDPTSRTWYEIAIAADRTLFTDPFIFFRLQEPGITASRRLTGGGGVVGVAVTLTNFSQFLSDLNVSENAKVYLFDDEERILAHYKGKAGDRTAAGGVGKQPGETRLPQVAEFGDPLLQKIAATKNGVDENNPFSGQIESDGTIYLVRVEPVGQQQGLKQFVAVAAPLSDFTGHIEQMQRRSIVAALIALAIALPLIFFIARQVAAKLSSLALEADKVRDFELDKPVELESFFLEVHNLAQAFGSMKKAVNVFGRYVPKALVREIVQSGITPKLGGQRQEVTVLFTDIADFTRISEETPPEELMLRTSEYFETLGSLLSRHHGVVDKYIGDAIMALWNAPNRDEDHVAHAALAALLCRKASHDLARSWSEHGIPVFGTRFGLHCGDAVVGNVGGADRMNFTAVGSTINVASRLESLNKRYGTEILVSNDVANRIRDQFLLRRIDRVLPVGVAQPVEIYELIAALPSAQGFVPSVAAGPQEQELVTMWEKIYAQFMDRNWQGSKQSLEEFMNRFEDDGPAQTLLVRCQTFVDTPPSDDWDGTTRLSGK
ncbi:adenylate/guanylate cyclase domain-containing protein [Roseibium alexandrii]|uniref:Adenylate cyclase 1 n=1 Tax=Roseibium alexandrii TaxID=388408 RepID=A0A0M7AQM2_9HYPH|nr:adenylate/guanylate cyclase domain-containing protein [Roseibium alexandrii]CTQ76716.1 Adenylate cyclase 1 [Roseibium alexandrii]